MLPGIVLIHGYMGRPDDLAALHQALTSRWGRDAVRSVLLPGHGSAEAAAPPFDRAAFEGEIRRAAAALAEAGRRVALVGHSTGGSLALSSLRGGGLRPGLVVLMAAPHTLDRDSQERWERHRTGRPVPGPRDTAAMIRVIRDAGRGPFDPAVPVLVLQGLADGLVPPADADRWLEALEGIPARRLFVEGAGHHFLDGESREACAIDAVQSAVSDMAEDPTQEERAAVRELEGLEAEAGIFLRRRPHSVRHLGGSPSGRGLLGLEAALKGASAAPVIANVEVTTRCELACVFCARTRLGPAPEDMAPETFRRVLDALPHAYRVTLVGLGEPLDHPRVADLVRIAAGEGRRVGISTNALRLDESMGRALLGAGLRAAAFSVDAADPELCGSLRPGTDLERVLGNIRGFMRLVRANVRWRGVSTAAFTAVSRRNAASLESLVARVAELGVGGMMLTDLNFSWNAADSARAAPAETGEGIHRALARAATLGLPVFGVHGLEDFGLGRGSAGSRLEPAAGLPGPASVRTHCRSPWQTAAVGVRGTLSVCDCQPDHPAGDLLREPFEAVWNGPVMMEHRRAMLSGDLPGPCRNCPRL